MLKKNHSCVTTLEVTGSSIKLKRKLKKRQRKYKLTSKWKKKEQEKKSQTINRQINVFVYLFLYMLCINNIIFFAIDMTISICMIYVQIVTDKFTKIHGLLCSMPSSHSPQINSFLLCIFHFYIKNTFRLSSYSYLIPTFYARYTSILLYKYITASTKDKN